MKVTHTHRGHCQLCTSVQAIDVGTGIVAKHGYTVSHGYYQGTCPGSGLLSLHVERTHADEAIKEAREKASELNATILAYTRGEAHPARVWNGEQMKVPAPTLSNPRRTKEERVMVDWAEATEHYQQRGVVESVARMQQAESQARGYANDLEKWAGDIYGKVEAYRAKDLEPREWKVGDIVRIGGKKGFDAPIEAIEEREYATRGWSLRSRSAKVAHALITYPAKPEKIVGKGEYAYVLDKARPARQHWEPLRHIKRPPSELAAMLIKEGKL